MIIVDRVDENKHIACDNCLDDAVTSISINDTVINLCIDCHDTLSVMLNEDIEDVEDDEE